MENWKELLYRNYVTSGQAGSETKSAGAVSAQRRPYLTDVVTKFVPANKGARISDLGCGHGELVHLLQETGYASTEGVDISEEQIELGKRSGVHNIHAGSIVEYLQGRKGEFDVLFLMDVLEHLERQELFDLLTLVFEALKPGGRMIVHVPNGAGIYGMRIRYGDFTHEGCFTERTMEQILTTLGFRDVRCYEERPTPHGLKSTIRLWLWNALTLQHRLLLGAETGVFHHILSSNMLSVADKPK